MSSSGSASSPDPAGPPPSQPALSTVIPPLILGTATFNYQYTDPNTLPYTSIVARALSLGINAFDTSPYYGPSETLLGTALTDSSVRNTYPRSSYFLITKVGRIASSSFDYSPAAIRASVKRSIARLGNSGYLDLVYCHDCEFVSSDAMLAAVRELRVLRNEGLVRYIGISGFPVGLLAQRAAEVLRITSEPLDAVLSYGNFCVQNTSLGSDTVLEAFEAAQVSVLLNASILNMGLLTTRGIDAGPQASWHPSPKPLRAACKALVPIAQKAGFSLEDVCIRWALSAWLHRGSRFGSSFQNYGHGPQRDAKLGVSVLGVTAISELEESVEAFNDALAQGHEDGASRIKKVASLVENEMWPALGTWKDFAWDSPDKNFVNTPLTSSVSP
ncbi:D-arabinose 1-dehydrogenase [Ceratocystis lukuohia]|uniref:D-arabinose 1-dehydrogenase n=1 Tax=Ceratocystis lukuohia TaxID=2019550 RepID=A0ABR4MNK4_9PEZI